jgi:hypothetical protein
MSWSPIIIIELVMVLGGALVWSWWELRGIKKHNEKVAKEKGSANAGNPDATDK